MVNIFTICPRCGNDSLSVIPRGGKDENDMLPVSVYCTSCGLEGNTNFIKYADRTEKVWNEFWYGRAYNNPSYKYLVFNGKTNKDVIHRKV